MNMDRPGPPDAKRMRTDSRGGLWTSNDSLRFQQPHTPHSGINLPPPLPPSRRHSEYNYATEDTRRQQSHTPYDHAPYGHRDTAVKRDPGVERPLLNEMRPHSTGHPIDNRPKQEEMRGSAYDATNPSYLHQPQPVGPYGNVLLPPGQQQPPQHSPTNYGYENERPMYGVPQDVHGISLEYTGTTGSSQKKRTARTTQACDACRMAKAKCTDPKPCNGCREKKIECVWVQPPPKQTDKLTSEMVGKFTELEQAVKENEKKAETRYLEAQKESKRQARSLEKQHRQQEERFRQENNRLADLFLKFIGNTNPELARNLHDEFFANRPDHDLKDEDHDDESVQPSIEGMDEDLDDKDRLPIVPIMEDFADVNGGGPADEPETEYFEQTALMADKEANEHFEKSNPAKAKESVAEDADGSAIPKGHTTGAHHILQWEAVAEMLKDRVPAQRISRFDPQSIEISRGILRLYGCGEGFEHVRSYERHYIRDENRASVISSSDGKTETSSPAAENCWGKMGPTSPYMESGSMVPYPNPEMLDRYKMPPLDEKTVLRLVGVYMQTLNIMHPIITAKGKEALLNRFLKQTGATKADELLPQPMPQQLAQFAGQGAKRKRASPSGEVTRGNEVLTLPSRSISTCIVLIMLALGRICEHKTRIPDAPPDVDSLSETSPLPNGGGILSPTPVFSPTAPAIHGMIPSPTTAAARDLHSRRPSSSVGDGVKYPAGTRNVDVIPGLAYFAMAMDILGSHKGCNTLQYVHANILASLYYGQLAKITQSHACLVDAGYALGVILEPSLKRFSAMASPTTLMQLTEKQKRKDNHLLFAYWTCLQLESDIVAELTRIPQSGVLRLEHIMPWPDVRLAVDDNDLNEKAGQCYTAQLWMRKQLNFIHRDLYGPGKSEEYSDQRLCNLTSYAIFDGTATVLNSIFRLCPDVTWEDDDPPATNILEARLRGKFYGGRVITYRHFLRAVLNLPYTSPGTVIPLKVLENARLCVQAMIHSSEAFINAMQEGGGGRLIVTNVWGTSHAQWGNIILLHAVARNKNLHDCVDREKLRALTENVRAFLREAARRGSALETDVWVLEQVAESCGTALTPGGSVVGAGSARSFGSRSQGGGAAEVNVMPAGMVPPGYFSQP